GPSLDSVLEPDIEAQLFGSLDDLGLPKLIGHGDMEDVAPVLSLAKGIPTSDVVQHRSDRHIVDAVERVEGGMVPAGQPVDVLAAETVDAAGICQVQERDPRR